MSQEPAAPWQAWIAALAIAAVAVALAWFAATGIGPPQAELYVDFNRDRIERFQAAGATNDSATVLMIGSSVLKYATREESQFAAAVSTATGRPVRVLRLVSNGGTFSNLVPLMEELKGLEVDVLVMQRDQLVSDRPRVRAFDLWLSRVRVLAGVVPAPTDWTAEDESAVQFGYPCWGRTLNRNLKQHVERNEGLVAIRPTGPSARAARELVEAALSTGASVALVDLPRRPDYDAEALQTRDAAMNGTAIGGLQARVSYWNHGPLEARYYCDVTHVTPEGQRVFSSWLESQVAAEIAQRRG
jgi:hypothetical protein